MINSLKSISVKIRIAIYELHYFLLKVASLFTEKLRNFNLGLYKKAKKWNRRGFVSRADRHQFNRKLCAICSKITERTPENDGPLG